MAMYINPKHESKEAFLKREGKVVPSTMNCADVPEGKTLVVYVNNGPWTAAAVIEHQRDLETGFRNPEDRRPQILYLVSTDALAEVMNQYDFEKLQQLK